MSYICWLYNCQKYDSELISDLIEKNITVRQGEKIFIKPNWVINPFRGKEDRWIATTTNVAMIEAVLKVLKKKLEGKGDIVIGDCPMGRADIAKIHALTKIETVADKYRTSEFKIEIIDIRNYYLKTVGEVIIQKIDLKGDPRGNCLVKLGQDSAFCKKNNKNYSCVDDMFPVSSFHNEKENNYVISQSVLDCDLFINLPKLKTHRSAGMTCAMKNLVGITANKNSVPHRTEGSVIEGGDSFPQAQAAQAGQTKAGKTESGLRKAVRKIKKWNKPYINYLFVPAKYLYTKIYGTDHRGYWHGNDTIWRSILDLNRILLYSNKQGEMQDTIQRRYICIADAIIAGEKEGPLVPTPKKCDLILVSDNPVTVDTVACKLMGFNTDKFPLLNAAYREMRWPLVDFKMDEVKITSDVEKWSERSALSITKEESFQFIPVEGWKGNV